MTEKNNAISFIRVLAMLSIIAGHWCTYKGMNTYQLGGVGVEAFLLISGYLYANKSIDSSKKWIIGRCKRVIVPLWITIALYVLITAVASHTFDGAPLLLYVFNVQGLKNIFYNFSYETVAGLAQTWFLTVLFASYFLMLGLKKWKKIENWIDDHSIASFVLAVIIQIAFAYVGIQLSYILQFFVGYFLGRCINKQKALNLSIVITFIVIALMLAGIRLVTKNYIDGSVLYDRIIARQSFNFLTLACVCIVVKFDQLRPVALKKVVTTKVWNAFDCLSYPLYLVHYMFLRGYLAIERFSLKSSILELLLFLMFTALLGIVVYSINELIFRKHIKQA